MPKKGKFIVIDGSDGSGKTTQFKKLIGRLRSAGKKVVTVHFPQHGKPSAYFVDKYLNGGYGGLKETGAYKTSLFYALDRFDFAPQIKKWIREGKMVVADRYTSSNMGHQGAKIGNRAARINLYRWLYDLEYGVLGIPKPDITVVLDVPAAIAYSLIGNKKDPRKYIKKGKRDLHEANLAYLTHSEKAYRDIVKVFPRDFHIVHCVRRGNLLSVEEVHERIWRAVETKIK